MIRCVTGYNTRPKDVQKYHLPPEPLVPLGRQNTTCRTWLRMPLHNIDSPPQLKSRYYVTVTLFSIFAFNFNQLTCTDQKSNRSINPKNLIAVSTSQLRRSKAKKFDNQAHTLDRCTAYTN